MSNFKICATGHYSDVKFIQFSDGAESAVLEDINDHEGVVRIVMDIQDCVRDMFRLMLVKDILDNNPRITHINLTMPYVPHARADRRFEEGSSHPLKVFCNVINSMHFHIVNISDPHSDVTTALLDRVEIMSQTQGFISTLPQIDRVTKDFILCAPDLGAVKKTFDTVQALGHEDYIQAVKIRDVKTGNIIKCDVLCDDLGGRDVVIVDDIVDRGNSFKFLAEKLLTKNCGKVILYTTHGIYPDGLDIFKGIIDYVFCYNVLNKYITQRDIQIFNSEGRD